MKRHALPLVALVALVPLAALLAAAVPVTAQDPVDLLQARAETKMQAAGDDPAGYAAEQTSDQGLADDAEWTIAYGCYVGHVATDDAGLPPPDVETCGGFEEALGVAEEERQDADEAVATAEALEDTAQVEAEAALEDLEATAGEIAAEPQTAPEAMRAYLDRTLRALGRIVDAATGFVRDTITGLGLGLAAIGKGAAIAAAVPVVGTLWLVDGTLQVATTATSGAATTLALAGDRVGDAVAATAGTVHVAAGGFGDAVAAAYAGVEAFVADVFGPAADTASAAEKGPDVQDDLVRHADDLLPPAEGLEVDLEPR